MLHCWSGVPGCFEPWGPRAEGVARVIVLTGWLWAVAKPWQILSPCLGLFSLPGGPERCSDRTSFGHNGVPWEAGGVVPVVEEGLVALALPRP